MSVVLPNYKTRNVGVSSVQTASWKPTAVLRESYTHKRSIGEHRRQPALAPHVGLRVTKLDVLLKGVGQIHLLRKQFRRR